MLRSTPELFLMIWYFGARIAPPAPTRILFPTFHHTKSNPLRYASEKLIEIQSLESSTWVYFFAFLLMIRREIRRSKYRLEIRTTKPTIMTANIMVSAVSLNTATIVSP